MTTIYLVRHAEAEGNLYRIAHGHYNSCITDDRGCRQIRALAERFRDVPVDAVYASDLIRTRTTAQSIYLPKGLQLHPDPAFREICMGEWEEHCWYELLRKYPQSHHDFNHRLDRWQVPGSETAQQVLDRYLPALRRVARQHDGQTVAIFSHGAAMRIVLGTLQGLSLHLLPGDFVTVIGSNGAGKSTLLNAISGSFFTDSGSIYLDGKNITFLPEYQRSRQIGRLFQDPMRGSAPHMTIEENLSLAAASGGWLSHVTRAEKAAFREKLAQLDMGLENRMKQPVGLLSCGQRQALTLVMATFKPPKLLLLDEHTAALDPATAEKVLEITRQTVSENRITTLMVTHNMHQALELGNRTLMMDRGHIILDVAGAERAGMTVEDLLAKFKSGAGKALDNDRILLSEQTKSDKKGASNAAD